MFKYFTIQTANETLPLVIEKYAKGELGVNVLFKHRAIAALDLIDDIHEAAFSTSSELLKKKKYSGI